MPARLDALTSRPQSPTSRIGDCVALGPITPLVHGPVTMGLWVRGGGVPAPVVIHRVRALDREIEAAEEAFFAATSAAGTRGAYAYDAGTLDVGGDRSFLFFEQWIEGLDLFELLRAMGVPRPGYEVGVRLALMRRVLAAVPAGYAYETLSITPTTLVLSWGGDVRLLPRMEIPPSRRIRTTRDDHDLKRWMPVTPETASGREPPAGPARQRVFQVGAVLAWIATGADPFASKNELLRLSRILAGEATVEGGAVLERYPRLRDLLLACLVADPRDRPESTGVIARDLAMAIGTWAPFDLSRETREDQEDPVVLASRVRDQFLERRLADERTARRIAREVAPDAPAAPFTRIDLSAVAQRSRPA